MYDGMNFDRHGPFSLDNKSSRHVNWRLNQTVVLRQKLDLSIKLDDGRTPEYGKRKMVVYNRRNRPVVDVKRRLVAVSLFDLLGRRSC